MEGLIKMQMSLKNSIERASINYGKSPKSRITLEYLEVRSENLDTDWNSFRTNHGKLLENNFEKLDKSPYMENDMYSSVEDIYIEYKTVLKTAKNNLLKNSGESSNKSDIKVDSGSSSTSAVKLPKIEIPQFSGKYSEWTTFRDLFISLIHNNNSIDKVQKLHYLKGRVTGEAEQLIRHIPITENNYKQCWALLEDRFNNKRYLVNCILKRLFSQRRLMSESACALKELLDTTIDCMNALTNLGIDVSTWDIIIIHIVTFKLDPETRKQWELNISTNVSTELPTLQQFKTFIESRFRALEFIEPNKRSHASHALPANPKALLSTNNSSPNALRCEYCSEGHKLCFFKNFIKLDYAKRNQFVRNNKICLNCLGGNHFVNKCNKITTCHICKRRHHTLLHPPSTDEQKDQGSSSGTSLEGTRASVENAPLVSCVSTDNRRFRQVLLATALIKLQSSSKDFQIVRALLDQGSQASFITEASVQLLRLKKIPIQGKVTGLSSDKVIVSKHMVTLVLRSLIEPAYEIEFKAYVLKHITSYLPERRVEVTNFINQDHLQLADPEFNQPKGIDVLLGAGIYSQILKDGVKKDLSGFMVAQCTTLGWIISGVVQPEHIEPNTSTNKITVMHAQVNENDILKKFWEIEEQLPAANKILTVEEQKCEEIFASTTKRTTDGRYVVKLPFKNSFPSCLGGNSRNIAVRRFRGIESKFVRDENLKLRYTEVINEYLKLGHMRQIKDDDKTNDSVYLPHHAVVREDKSTTKVREVFDASCKNENAISLNDTLMVGPTLQSDLRHIILRWRTHPIGIVADIIKMYRQVQISERDARYQRIVWRDHSEEELKDYELLTVTFGTACAPYLAVKVLHQVAKDEGKDYPLAASKVHNSFLMDDLMTGCSNVKEGERIYKEMRNLLKKGGFILQKWNSNNRELLKIIDRCEEEINDKPERKKRLEIQCEDMEEQGNIQRKDEKDIFETDTTKILGLTWSRRDDDFKYSVQLPPRSGPATKRTIVSDIARLFDPLGWRAPSIVWAKMFIQRLWLAGVQWDDELPAVLIEEWETYRSDLTHLNKVHLPRWLGTTANDAVVELHGFCDASRAAYAAVIYSRIIDQTGRVHVTLLTAKTKVAPIKQVSIPRLELCGAVLVSKLLVEVANAMNIERDKVRVWCDSTVVLAWLNSHPSRWKTFMGNRVSEILTNLDANQWAHVSTRDNPADCASRGVQPKLLSEQRLWFDGPQFLREQSITYKRPLNVETQLEAVKSHVGIKHEESPWEKFSSLRKLLRVVAFCRRFLRHTGDKYKYLKKKEIDEALKCLVRECQKEEFQEEYLQLKEKRDIRSKTSKIRSLCPYLDHEDIIRAGGRLQQSSLPNQTKHPIVVPHSSYLSKLIVADAHERSLHGGVQLTFNSIRLAYWIIGAKSLVKQHIRRCVTCVKYSARVRNQFMGSLPSVRCTPARPFLRSSVDYAGPINMRSSKGRGHRSYKGYVCLFICMATRAVHLEAVSDLSTQGFLAAFRRFVSRRGHCAQMWSDNGTNFVGAARELAELLSIQQSIAEHLEANGTEWHFIPPHAPNFGGLWEAAVKSTKFHLRRVLGDTTLTYEEMSTLLSQVEACLNSRPMTIVNSENVDEPVPLTPAHFLVGDYLIAVPDSYLEHTNVSPLHRWQMVQKMLQNFWRRWSQEYLTSMMNRYKWAHKVPEPEVGDVVLVMEPDLPPSRWLLGRIVQKHPGHDNVTRVVTLRTKNGILKRPISKLCILPVNSE